MFMEKEKIMVVERKFLKEFSGFMPYEGNEGMLDTIRKHAFFKDRAAVEEDPSLKQVIPYIIFVSGDRLFVMRRLDKSGEKRLHNLASIGIGGHIREEDGSIEEILDNALKREFFEEVYYDGPFQPEIFGYINDDSNDVGRVHFGVCFIVRGGPEISVREQGVLEGRLTPFSEMKTEGMETWSRIVSEQINSVLGHN